MASIMASKSFHFQQWLSTLQQKMQKIDFIWVNEKKINSCHYSVVFECFCELYLGLSSWKIQFLETCGSDLPCKLA